MGFNNDDVFCFFIVQFTLHPLCLKIANKTLSFLFLIVPESLLLSVLLTFATDLGLPSHLTIGETIQHLLNSCTLNWQM